MHLKPSPGDGLPPGWNNTATDYERDQSIHEVWVRRVEDAPDAIAIEDPSESLTYRELDDRARQLARRLEGHCHGHELCVGVLAERSIGAVVAFLAALKVGAAYVPLDPKLPDDRLRFIIDDTGLEAVLAPAMLAQRGRTLARTAIDLDMPYAEADASDRPPRSVGPRSLVYVMYTSGTSGRPKGVAIEHRGVLRYARGAPDLMPRPGEGMLFVNQLGFDGSTYEIWGALLNGARLVVHPGAPTPREIARTVVEYRVDVSMLPAGLFHQLVDWATSDQDGAAEVSAALAGLRLVLAVGDVLSPSHAARFLSVASACRLVNAYGPTEATVTGSVYDVTHVADGQPVPIGRPLPNTTLYVLDEHLRPVAPGQRGELYIGGEGVARGYLNLPDLTAERFLPDPFDGQVDARLYRTGDFVRMGPDDNLEYLGRIDDQVKIRGYRVEPAESEAVLNTHPGVRQAIVVARQDLPGHKRLVAYATTEPSVQAEELRSFAAQRLPEYLVPSAVVLLPDFPLTDNGKPDRGALPVPGLVPSGRAPETATEQAVAEAVEAVLKCEGVSAEDDFFNLGGDSLLVIQMLSRLHDRLRVTLPMSLVFSARTVEAIAAGADELISQGDAPSGLPPLPPLQALRMEPEPVSVSQSLALFHTELADVALPYQSQAVIWFDGRLDPDLLRRAMASVVARHEVLRTTFERGASGWAQVIQPSVSIVLPVVDLRDEPDVDAAFERFKAERFGRRIDLGHAPIIQWTLGRLSDTRWALLQVEHHVIHDGLSFARLLGELTGAYRDLLRGRPVAPDEPPIQYRQFSRWQRAFADTEPGRRQMHYWKGQLEQLPPPLDLPTDRDRPIAPSYRGSSLSRDLSPALSDAVRRVAAGRGATPYMLMLTAFFALLHRYSGQRDLVVGSGLAGRRAPELSNVVGMVVNTVALRVAVDAGAPASVLLDAVRTVCLQAQDHQELPFEEVVRRIAPQRRAGYAPVYQHLFSFHDAPIPALDIDGLHVTAEDVQSNNSAKADINVVVVNRRMAEDPRNGTLRIVWEYARDLFDDRTAARMLEQYVLLLEAMVTDLSRPVDRLPLTSPAETEALLAAARNPRPYERDASIWSIFAARVAESPSAVAVTGSGRSIRYDELGAAAEVMAGLLVDAGVQSGGRVAVVDDSSPEMIATLLGILKVGAAYVGIDMGQPPARTVSLLEAAGVKVACARAGVSVPGAASTIPTSELLDSPAVGSTGSPGAAAATDIAYISFTSGSTGEPKGVAATHRGVVRLVRGADYVRLGPEEVGLAMAPLSFDASTFEIWGPLLNGGCLVLAPPGPLSTAEIARVLREERVSVAWFTAAIFHEMVDHELPTMQAIPQLLAGGDVLSPAHVNRLLATPRPDGVLVNGYGPTEGTTFTCCHRMSAGTNVSTRVPIGRPISNTAAYVVDGAGELVPPGVIGEIWAGGDGVASGYVGRPDLTAQAFLDDPFEGDGSGRVYRTGDLGRARPDGTLDFLGRADRQVKVRGYRVEPAETESVLLSHPAIRQAHVDTAEYGPGDRRLVAYMVGEPVGRPADGDLRRHVAARLPSYFVPAAFVWLEYLPMTPNGKLDRTALPAPPSMWFEEARPLDPGTTLDYGPVLASRNVRALLAIWQEVTGVRDIGLDDDFFDLGGHSLLAVTLFAAIERTIGARLPLSTIFSAPTVRQLAEVLRSEGWDAPWGSLVTLQSKGNRTPLFAITAGDGNVVGFGPLSRRLGADQPFYVLQPHGLDGRALLHRTVPAMARRYVREIQRVQPHGPYVLVGRCFGALVAVEITRQLERRGESVALLVAIDSLGPLWQERRLANGLPYDEVMNLARALGAEAGVTFDAIFDDPAAADSFVDWLRAPVAEDGGSVVNRYLHAAYRVRPDLRAAYPLDAHGHSGLVDWAWVGGRSEMGMNPALLETPSAWARAATQSVDPRRTTRRQKVGERALDLADLATRGRVPRLAERRRSRILALATENVLDYRAGPIAAPVVLLRSEDDEDDPQKAQLARWHGMETGGVAVHYVSGSHHAMLREPHVALLAQQLRECLIEALSRPERETAHA